MYSDEGDDLLSAYLLRYPSAVVTLETALSLYGITNEWLAPLFCFSFGLGYRPMDDPDITQIWDDNGIRLLGETKMEREGISFLCHDAERLRKEIL